MKIRFITAVLLFSLLIFPVFGQDFTQNDDREYVLEVLENVGFDIDFDSYDSYEDFQLEDLDGGFTKLSDYEGNVILLNFWATWCGPCRSEMPSMEELYEEFELLDLEIVAVNIGDDAETVDEFIDEYGYTFPVLLDESGEIGKMYEAYAIPTTYIIDKQGYLIAGITGSIEWDTDEMIEVMDILTSEGIDESDIESTGQSAGVDSAVNWKDGNIYFMKGSQFSLFNWSNDGVASEYPMTLSGLTWPGLTFERIDAILDWGNGKTYMFSGDQYIRFDKDTNSSDTGYPKPIQGNWPGLVFDSIDAAVHNGKGKVYFFKDDQYIRYDIAADKADPGYPLTIDNVTWPGLSFTSIDAAVNWNDSKFYFFSGEGFTSYDIAADSADPDYPMLIADYWPGLEF